MKLIVGQEKKKWLNDWLIVILSAEASWNENIKLYQLHKMENKNGQWLFIRNSFIFTQSFINNLGCYTTYDVRRNLVNTADL